MPSAVMPIFPANSRRVVAGADLRIAKFYCLGSFSGSFWVVTGFFRKNFPAA